MHLRKKSTKLFKRQLYSCANPICSVNEIGGLAPIQGFRQSSADLVQVGMFCLPHAHVLVAIVPQWDRKSAKTDFLSHCGENE